MHDPADSNLSDGTASSRPLRLLLVEDHDDTVRFMSKVLQCAGHQVAAASCAAEAITLANTGKFDMVISDVCLPDASGYELMTELRKSRNLRGLKGISLSGLDRDEDFRKSREAGFSEHIVKPVDIDVLHDAILRLARS